MENIRLTKEGDLSEKDYSFAENLDGDKYIYEVENPQYKIGIEENDGLWELPDDKYSLFSESKELVNERLLGLQQEYLENLSNGFEADSGTTIDSHIHVKDLRTDNIFIEMKPFSIRQVKDMIDDKDLELSPSFQRNFVWDKTRQSRLIESLLMGLPLPSFYLSQYKDGILTVVDGLQRLSTIYKFMNNELTLCNMECLTECNDKNYSQLKNILSPYQNRKFGQTQLVCYVIDYRSPSRLKYDLFSRLNTGGMPLNNQEIRNCLSREPLRKALLRMTRSENFKLATSNSIRDNRMDAQGAALKFMCFYDLYSDENPIGDYNGNMDLTLNAYVDNKNLESDFSMYEDAFSNAMYLAFRLFGRYAFRKVDTNNRRKPINKLLLLTMSVLLAQHYSDYQVLIEQNVNLVTKLKDLLSDDEHFFNAITWSTSNRDNILYVFKTLKEKLFDSSLLHE